MNTKKYWLALWWWAARGFAHIWLIKFLEEKNIEITEVSWTSMWAIVAWCLAIWMNSDEMQELCKSINYLKLIDFDLKKWIIKWNKIKKFLEKVFWDKKIEDCKIPLKIISADLESWEQYLFKKWKITDAIRASISIPWVLSPYEFEWKKLVDGWILNNLPVDSLLSENIIASSVLRDLSREVKFTKNIFWIEFDKWIFTNSYHILQKTIDIMMRQNEKASIKCWKNVLLVNPKFSWIDYYEFHKSKEIIKVWYDFTKDVFKNIL